MRIALAALFLFSLPTCSDVSAQGIEPDLTAEAACFCRGLQGVPGPQGPPGPAGPTGPAGTGMPGATTWGQVTADGTYAGRGVSKVTHVAPGAYLLELATPRSALWSPFAWSRENGPTAWGMTATMPDSFYVFTKGANGASVDAAFAFLVVE